MARTKAWPAPTARRLAFSTTQRRARGRAIAITCLNGSRRWWSGGKVDPKSLLLRTAFHHAINEPTPEAGFERFSALTGSVLEYNLFQDTVADCVAGRLVKDPVRLTEGALHCH